MIYDSDRDFTWDPAKNDLNERKHGISFTDASDIFYVEPAYVEETTRFEYDERRWKAVGVVNNQAICVIFTERNDETRIISARAARRDERRKLGESAEAT
jgi:uncharacterized protein